MSIKRFIHDYVQNHVDDFNDQLFLRSDEAIIDQLEKIIISIQTHGLFTIKVKGFTVVDNYDDIQVILRKHYERVLKGSKKAADDNRFNYIDLQESKIKLLIIHYETSYKNERENLDVIIEVPRVVNKFYFFLKGNYYSPMYQIVDASTYNNTNSNSAKKKQSICFKTMFAAIRAYRYFGTMKDIDGNEIQCIYYVTNVFKKSVLLLKYLLANFGVTSTISFLRLSDIFILKDISNIDKEINYIFPINGGGYIIIPKIMYDSIPVAQSFVFTISLVTGLSNISNIDIIFDKDFWLKSLGADFVPKNVDAMRTKGLSVLDSLNFVYDIGTKNDLKLPEKDKETIFHVLRWIIYEFNSLRIKDNIKIRFIT